jgi:hypothetical protein
MMATGFNSDSPPPMGVTTPPRPAQSEFASQLLAQVAAFEDKCQASIDAQILTMQANVQRSNEMNAKGLTPPASKPAAG